MTARAKCPACGDTEGSEAVSLPSVSKMVTWVTEWRCGSCGAISSVSEWLGNPEPNRIHPDDIEAIARRVVELMKGES